MAKKQQQSSHPPQPPEITRKLQVHIFQLIGIPIMMLVPILALFGIFGKTVDSASTAHSELEMRVEYPTRFRFKMIEEITVSIFNASSQPFDTVQVGFERAYIEEFSTVTFTPAVKHVTDIVYLVEVNDLQPGETRIVSVTIQAEKFGKHTGVISAVPDIAQELRVSISTFAFP